MPNEQNQRKKRYKKKKNTHTQRRQANFKLKHINIVPKMSLELMQIKCVWVKRFFALFFFTRISIFQSFVRKTLEITSQPYYLWRKANSQTKIILCWLVQQTRNSHPLNTLCTSSDQNEREKENEQRKKIVRILSTDLLFFFTSFVDVLCTPWILYKNQDEIYTKVHIIWLIRVGIPFLALFFSCSLPPPRLSLSISPLPPQSFSSPRHIPSYS